MACRPVVSDLHNSDEEPESENSDPDLQQSEKPNPHQRDADPHHCSAIEHLNITGTKPTNLSTLKRKLY